MNYFKELCVFNYLDALSTKLATLGNLRDLLAYLRDGYLSTNQTKKSTLRRVHTWFFKGSWRMQWLPKANIENKISSPTLI